MKPLAKPLILLIMLLLLMIPLMLVEGVVQERASYRDVAVQNIAASWTGPQTLNGPFLVVDYHANEYQRRWDKNLDKYVVTPKKVKKRTLIRPTDSQIATELEVSFRHRGIYDVPVYKADIRMTGSFDLQHIHRVLSAENEPSIDRISIETGVSDARGITGVPELQWNKQTLKGEPGVSYHKNAQGFHAVIDHRANANKSGIIDYSGSFSLRGINLISIRPAGFDSRIDMQSNWRHPSFQGDFLPDFREVNDKGFQSSWTVSSLASGNSLAPEVIRRDADFTTIQHTRTMGVQLFQPVDIYTLGDRATKYGVLFILVTFTLFYLIELMKGERLHPIQYSLVGMALAIFFLLLLSFSEHIGFGVAYLIASVACVGMITLYTRSMMSGKQAVLIGVTLSVLYFTCYVILQLEGFALLVGSLLLFGLLACVMYITRKIDWYKLSSGLAEERGWVKKESTG